MFTGNSQNVVTFIFTGLLLLHRASSEKVTRVKIAPDTNDISWPLFFTEEIERQIRVAVISVIQTEVSFVSIELKKSCHAITTQLEICCFNNSKLTVH